MYLASDVGQWLVTSEESCMHGHGICSLWKTTPSNDMHNHPRFEHISLGVCTSAEQYESWSERIGHATYDIACIYWPRDNGQRHAENEKPCKHHSWHIGIDWRHRSWHVRIGCETFASNNVIQHLLRPVRLRKAMLANNRQHHPRNVCFG